MSRLHLEPFHGLAGDMFLEACRSVARTAGVPWREVYQKALAAAGQGS